jgi:tetratricopeptide (TPR) repeat protein
MVRGNAQLALDQPEMAVASFSAAIALRPEYAPAWLNRALAYSKLHFGDLALDDLNRAIILDGSQSEAYIQRAFAKQALDKWDESVDDLTAALDCQNCSTRAWFLRSFARRQSGDWLGSLTDWAMGLKEPPNDDLSFVARAENRLNDPPAALADVESALRLNPLSPDALQLKAHILSERMHKADESLAVLDKTIELYPDSAIARAGRGVVLARQGKRTEAIRDAEESLRRDSKAPNLYMIACIYALTSRTDPGDRLPALEYLSSALRRGYGLDIVDEDSDLDPIRGLSEFKRIVGAAKELATIRRAENPAAH